MTTTFDWPSTVPSIPSRQPPVPLQPGRIRCHRHHRQQGGCHPGRHGHQRVGQAIRLCEGFRGRRGVLGDQQAGREEVLSPDRFRRRVGRPSIRCPPPRFVPSASVRLLRAVLTNRFPDPTVRSDNPLTGVTPILDRSEFRPVGLVAQPKLCYLQVAFERQGKFQRSGSGESWLHPARQPGKPQYTNDWVSVPSSTRGEAIPATAAPSWLPR